MRVKSKRCPLQQNEDTNGPVIYTHWGGDEMNSAERDHTSDAVPLDDDSDTNMYPAVRLGKWKDVFLCLHKHLKI